MFSPPQINYSIYFHQAYWGLISSLSRLAPRLAPWREERVAIRSPTWWCLSKSPYRWWCWRTDWTRCRRLPSRTWWSCESGAAFGGSLLPRPPGPPFCQRGIICLRGVSVWKLSEVRQCHKSESQIRLVYEPPRRNSAPSILISRMEYLAKERKINNMAQQSWI